MAWITIVCLIVSFIFILITIVFLIVTRIAGKRINVQANTPQVEVDNFRKRFTNGYTRGLLKNQKLRRNGTYLIEFFPTDVKQGDNIPRPEVQSFIVAKEFRQVLAEGDSSDRRTIIKTIARNPADIPEKLRNTHEGIEEGKQGQLAFIEKTFSDAVPEGDRQVKEIILNSHRGLGKNFVKTLEDRSKVLDKVDAGEKRKPEN